MPDLGNGWDQCKREIYHRFSETEQKMDRLVTAIEGLTNKLNLYITENEVFKKEIKIKAGLWGAVSGSIPVLISILIGLLFYLIQKN